MMSVSIAANSKGEESSMPDLEKTNNRMGFMFNKIGISFDYWVSSLPASPKPLLDVGAAYGVHTLHALHHGRDVIAVDCDETHLKILRERVDLRVDREQQDGKAVGRLIGTRLGRLPCKEILEEGSVSGVLLSEVIHFMRPEVVQDVFDDIFGWLDVGGLFVATTIGVTMLRDSVEMIGFKVKAKRTVSETLSFIKDAGDDQVLTGAPGLVLGSDGYEWSNQMPRWFYFLSTREMGLYARRAGFAIEKLEYIQADKYPILPSKNSTALLVARKR